MDSLLRWAIEHSDSSGAGDVRHRDLDPGVIDVILGKPDAQQMQESLAAATDVSLDDDTRLSALDHFEMLVQHIDNANNISAMHMWAPLHALLLPPSSDPILVSALWVLGTAVQNNPAAQSAYLAAAADPLPALFHLLAAHPSPAVRSKTVYLLSGLLKHNAHAVASLDRIDAWPVLKSAIQDSDISVRRKLVFLLNSLLLPNADTSSPSSPVHPNSHAGLTATSSATSQITAHALQQHDFLPLLLDALINPFPHGNDGDHGPDPDFAEKTLRLLFTYLTVAGGHITADQKRVLNDWLLAQSDHGDLSDAEWATFLQHVA